MVELTKREYDYSKLRGRIAEKMETLGNYAKAIGISNQSLRLKMQNKVPFRQCEIQASMNPDVLDLKPEELGIYFFTLKVGKNQTK